MSIIMFILKSKNTIGQTCYLNFLTNDTHMRQQASRKSKLYSNNPYYPKKLLNRFCNLCSPYLLFKTNPNNKSYYRKSVITNYYKNLMKIIL